MAGPAADGVVLDSFCAICKESEKPLVTVTERGFNGLYKFSIERKDKDLTDYLDGKKINQNCTSVRVHENCRKWYNNKRRIESEPSKAKKSKRLNQGFEWKTDCFLCGAICDSKHGKGKVRSAATMEIKETIERSCQGRLEKKANDNWAIEVQGRIKSCIDFVAAESKYHTDCFARFTQQKEMKSSENLQSGRKVNIDMKECFEKTCQWLESELVFHSVIEVQEKMKEFSGKEDVYGVQYLKSLLTKKYEDHVAFCNEPGRENIVYFKDMSDYLIKGLYRERKTKVNTEEEETENEAIKIQAVAAKLIKDEIRRCDYKNDVYPSVNDMKNLDWSPPLLKQFLKYLVQSELKQESLAQCIVKAAKRNTIPPLLLGIGVDLDQTIGSKWLVRHLSKLGFSITHDEVTLYRQSVLEAQVEPITGIPEDLFIQWSADNVDHNVATLDGNNTFHGMGMVACMTPSGSFNPLCDIRRLKKRKPVSEIIKDRGVPIVNYNGNFFNNYPKLKPLDSLSVRSKTTFDFPLEILWHSIWHFTSSDKQRPFWSGFMQQQFSTKKESFEKSNVIMLPIIDLQPTNPSCIYSTLLFIQSQASKYQMQTPIVTFDQPLWLKASGIIAEKNLNIICRLGGFHTLMSFIGSIGHIMGGSGLEDALMQIYAENSVPHILSGKAYPRALRGLIIVDSALNNIITNSIMASLCLDERSIIEKAFENVLSGEEVKDDCYEPLHKFNQLLKAKKDFLKKSNRTAKLWIQFMEYVDTIKMYIRAERIGDWDMHLSATRNMLNLFAAAGHFHYAKSARLYLQQMLELPVKYPNIHQAFKEKGYHTVRRSDRYWAGLWSDLIIEQVMMRSIKSRGGLTRGRGFNESTRHQWVHTIHQCAVIHEAMSEITQVTLNNSEQHVEMGKSRIKRDVEDLNTITSWIEERNPFEGGTELRSISTGICDDGSVNCDASEDIGRAIQQGINNIPLHEIKMKRMFIAKTIESLYNSVKIDQKKSIVIKPTSLFNRLIAIAQRESDLEQFFYYELTSYPMSIFKDGLMRKPNKAVLKNALLTSKVDVDPNTKNVLDGGALLHKVRWTSANTFDQVCERYVDYVKNTYGSSSIVFDGYSDVPSTKDHEHMRRNINKRGCTDVRCNALSKVTIKQDVFLSSSSNKAQLIQLLSTYLKRAGNDVVNCNEDADTYIVRCALEKSRSGLKVNVVADDTDVALLLLYHWQDDMEDITLTSEKSNTTFSIKGSLEALKEIKSYLLVLHAWTGCDTTSAIHSKGKTSLLKKIETSDSLKSLFDILKSKYSDQADISEAGIELMSCMYGGKKGLSKLR